ncbi:MAG: twin-arginine translocase subunit TatC [Bacillota bacterium]
MAKESMTLLEHLEELRKIIIKIFLFILLGTVISYIFFEDLVLQFITAPLDGKNISLVQLTVTEAFMTKLKISILSGAVITLPFSTWQIWSFILPALYTHEKKYVLTITPISAFLFVVGVLFGYYVVLPFALIFFIAQGGKELLAMLSFARYVSFVLGFLVPFGLVFQLPLAVIFLSRIGVADYRFFKAKRKYAILIIFIISAVLTPADVVSQLLMAGPVILLYEISIVFSWLLRRKVNEDEE